MGLYDQITISKEFKLPLTDEQHDTINKHVGHTRSWNRVFQTKDLDCWLGYYLINDAGKLFEIQQDGSKKFIETTKEIRLYDYITSSCVDTDLSIDFNVTLIRGVVDQIKTTEFSTRCNKNRRSIHEKMEQAAVHAAKTRNKLTWKMYNVMWATPIDLVLRHVGRFARWLDHATIKARRVLMFWN